ncbi:tetratricopeptide repeat protein [Kibdelosporangium philippinense]|uniref:Tetratricopeptide repeat protein n=1 Tax=Kibdelosporangium philippinense TaxID=211113 RepID=A0ABS8ZH74_9PSEU|nr:tetratricopeptide repeat protein [Kibdelosporangium philippinense]MCE7007161.1 tetratricopeptide repeat protein [Kibdelosporangium philippinense]
MNESLADETALLSDEVAAMFNDLGVLMALRGHTAEAERFYRRSIEIRQRLPQDTDKTALTWRNLAVLPAG